MRRGTWILVERELEVPSRSVVENTLIEEEIPGTVDADEVMEDVDSLSEYTLSRAEKSYLECSVKNPKDVWNEFTVIDTDNFDFSKTNILLNQKCKNFFLLEERKGDTMKCFGLQYTEDVSFKNWLNRTPEQLKLWCPSDFQELLDFTDSSNLDCFKNMDKEAINYETSVLHISAHMFFENTEVKQRWQSILNDFAFKSGANKRAFKIATTLNKKREVEVLSSDSNISMGFVEKFIEVVRLRMKISRISGEIKANDWSTAWSLIWEMNCLTGWLFTSILYSRDYLNQSWKRKQEKIEWKVLE